LITVSVVIPCFNARNWILDTLTSVFDQRDIDLEVIVVDDGSTDGSSELVARDFPQVRLEKTQSRNPGAARDLGTQLSSGTFIQYLDADDMLARGKLERQLQALGESGADVAYGDWLELRATTNGEFQMGRRITRRIEGDPQIALFTDFWSPPAAYLFRRDIVERVGGWRRDLPIIQDARFVLDCALQGGQFVYCPGDAAYYRVHQSGSVSTRDPRQFARDCLHNALSAERWWQGHGGISGERKAALTQVYGQVARGSFEADRDTFDIALQALERLEPGYVPRRPRALRLLSRLGGYRRAEAVASRYRWAKRQLRSRPTPARTVERHVRLHAAARWAYAVPGVRNLARHGLRLVVQRSPLSRRTKQQLHNFLAIDVAPSGVATCAVDVGNGRTLRLRIPVRDDLTRYWYFWGYAHYELGTTRLLRRLLPRTRVFFDVGANLGYHTLLAAALLEGRGVVHAFEPWKDVYDELATNARLNGFRCLELSQVALADRDGESCLYLPDGPEWTMASLLGQRAHRYERVQTWRFDSYCRGRVMSRVDVMKIDVEGAELQVLQGMGSLLSRWQPDIILEVLEPFAAELDAFFAETPYRKFRIRDTGLEELQHITAELHDRNIYLSCQPENVLA
jgi:FkbM family methyltransferase